MKHGQRISGRFVEILRPNEPIKWDEDKPTYFVAPSSEKTEDEAARITRQFAAAVAKSSAKRQQTPQAQTRARYFTVPKED